MNSSPMVTEHFDKFTVTLAVPFPTGCQGRTGIKLRAARYPELAVPLPYGTLRERGSKLRGASRREILSDIGLKPWRVPIPYEE